MKNGTLNFWSSESNQARLNCRVVTARRLRRFTLEEWSAQLKEKNERGLGRKGSLKQKPKKHLIMCQWAPPYVLTLCLGV